MEKTMIFKEVKFSQEAISDAREHFNELVSEKEQKSVHKVLAVYMFGGESWSHDNEAEYFSDYNKDHDYSNYQIFAPPYYLGVEWDSTYRKSKVQVASKSREQIESLFQIFERYREHCMLPPLPIKEPQKILPRVFIGHGRSDQWRDLKDHLQDKHGYEVVAYEVGSRAGHTIRDILEEMLSSSSIAFLVMTGEDKDENGNMRARQNVVHELGLFQGRLGFGRAIVILEEGTEEFSNIHGINQIRYARGNIKETFGEVLATLRREFGN
jgi:hypothetical protein